MTRGLHYEPKFCDNGAPYNSVSWGDRDAVISKIDGTVTFRHNNVKAPTSWSDMAVQVVAQKYLRGKLDAEGNPVPGRETGIDQLIDRVVDTLGEWAGYYTNRTSTGYYQNGPDRALLNDSFKDGVYFDNQTSWQAWKDDLKWLLVNQYLCFNSPVWFNVGVEEWPQCSACFILRLNDWMIGPDDVEFELDDHGLLAAQVKEGIIFTRGSGSGINLSRVRSSKEWLSSGGKPTGPLSFARGLDAWASSIKSGGKTRRAAKMLILDVDHPNIDEFISVKAEEEKVAKLLIAAGYPGDMDGFAYQHAYHQNSNLSVRASDAFFSAVELGQNWPLISRSSHHLDGGLIRSMIGLEGRVVETVDAKHLLGKIAEYAWECGDPGIQFHDTINKWHTCAADEPIFASNPCSEYMFIDETSCNLASLNLKKFFPFGNLSGEKVTRFVEAIRALTIAMDVIVSGARYPTENIRKMSQKYRTLGVGYANLGGLLMSAAIPYDSAPGRAMAAAITSVMTAAVYDQSAALAKVLGPFERWEANRESATRVMQAHRDAASKIDGFSYDSEIRAVGAELWDHVVSACHNNGLRNAQATVLAPTGTIAFMMDCETTGIEPELGLIKYKTLSGGGTLKMVNPSLTENLSRWTGLDGARIGKIVDGILAGGSIRKLLGSTMSETLAQPYRTSFPPDSDPSFSLPWESHVQMMAAVQPFLSGAISKTVNMPRESTPDDIANAYVMAWRMGLKAIAIYRDGSKGVQAVSTKATADGLTGGEDPARLAKLTEDFGVAQKRLDELENLLASGGSSIRRKPSKEVHHVRVRFDIDSHRGYLFVGFYEDTGEPCEIFVTLSKTGSALQGFTNAFCVCFSMLLQYGVPLEKLVQQFQDTEFEPKGIIPGDPDVKICRSVVDYIVRKVKAVAQRAGKWHLVEVEEMPDDEVNFVQLEFAHAEPPTSIPATTTGTPRRSGRVCRCGSFDVQIVGKCLICRTCGSEDGGCFG
jgi:ribonucleoside-diphosphate reductase alpha chain